MAIFHCYVSSPEGTSNHIPCHTDPPWFRCGAGDAELSADVGAQVPPHRIRWISWCFSLHLRLKRGSPYISISTTKIGTEPWCTILPVNISLYTLTCKVRFLKPSFWSKSPSELIFFLFHQKGCFSRRNRTGWRWIWMNLGNQVATSCTRKHLRRIRHKKKHSLNIPC